MLAVTGTSEYYSQTIHRITKQFRLEKASEGQTSMASCSKPVPLGQVA